MGDIISEQKHFSRYDSPLLLQRSAKVWLEQMHSQREENNYLCIYCIASNVCSTVSCSMTVKLGDVMVSVSVCLRPWIFFLFLWLTAKGRQRQLISQCCQCTQTCSLVALQLQDLSLDVICKSSQISPLWKHTVYWQRPGCLGYVITKIVQILCYFVLDSLLLGLDYFSC